MPEIEPCPFCGGEAQVYEYKAEQAIYDKDTLGFLDIEERTVFGVGCPQCGCIIADKPSEQKAVEAWNRRTFVNTWTSTDTRLPVEEWKQHKESTGEKTAEFIVIIKGAKHPTALCFDGTRWLDDSGYNYPVQYWMNMPQIPMEDINYES